MGERHAKYVGKVCAKHPELKGWRRSPGTNDEYRCVGCTRLADGERRTRKRTDLEWQARRRARDRRREQQPHRKAKGALRRAIKKQALVTLIAAEHLRITALYAEAARRTAETGIVHHVDHDKPLAFGGVHHPDNMLVVPASINLAKGARYASTWDFISS